MELALRQSAAFEINGNPKVSPNTRDKNRILLN
jgi:hypothetical protein